MLLSAIDLVVFLSLAAQFAIAGYFLYLVYWLIELPPADAAAAGAAGRAAARAGPDPGLQRAAGRRAGAGRGGGARLAARPIDDPAARRQHRHHLRHRRPRRGASAGATASTSRTSGAPTAAASRPARWRRASRSRDAPYVAVFDADFVPAPDWLQRRHGGDPGRAEGCLRADPHRVGQRRAQLADPRPAPDAGCPFRRRAGRPRPPRRAVPVQRHRRHLAPRRGRGGGRLVARHPVGGSRPGAAHASQGLARRVPDGAARDGRAAAASSTISAPSRAAGRRASCRSRASCSDRSGIPTGRARPSSRPPWRWDSSSSFRCWSWASWR